MQEETQFNVATVWETLADAVAERPAFSLGTERTLTYAELEYEANQVAHLLARHGIGTDDRVALYLLNSVEHVELILALLKINAVGLNVNYRYTATELRYLFTDSEAAGIAVELPEHQQIVAELLPSLDRVRTLIVLGEPVPALAEAARARGVEIVDLARAAEESGERTGLPERSGDNTCVLYTGGTTGYPKGVLWRQHDFFMKPLSGGNPYGDSRADYAEIAQGAKDFPPLTCLSAAPLMHGAALFSLFTFFSLGAHYVLMRQFDAEEMIDLYVHHGAQIFAIVGDGMGSPLVEVMERRKDEVDWSTLFSVSSGGAIWSNGIRDRMLAIKPDLYLRDNFGASESGNDGEFSLDEHGVLRMPASDEIGLVDHAHRPIPPGSEEIGMIARIGHVPLCYLGDPEKSARTFVTLPDGRRASILGDMGRIEADGSIVFLGRGSGCINTKGEKVFPEEVEAALHAHPGVADALVVGLADAEYGGRVAAVVSLRESHRDTVTVTDLTDHCRTMLAGYKVPREVALVDEVRRTPAGKADYRWAASVF